MWMLTLLPFLIHLAFCNPAYQVSSLTSNSSHIVATLRYNGSQTYYIKPTSIIYPELTLTIICHSYSDLTLSITDVNNTRFRIPTTVPFPEDPLAKSTFPLNLSLFNITINGDPFEITITRNPNGQVLFDTTGRNIVFSKYYVEISTKVATKLAWGFGERFSSRFRLQTGKYTVFGRDRPDTIDTQSGHQTYGSYPIYLMRDSTKNSSNYHINYFRNSNAMDVIIDSEDDGYRFTYKTIGGMIDFRFFLENSPAAVVEKFHTFLGPSHVPPFWAMGFHQSRWGYTDVGMLEEVIKKYKVNGIPLDTIWSDIDYMHKFEDFTIDESSFPLNRLAEIIKQYNYVPIIDAGIKIAGNGTAYAEGKKKNLFIKDAVGQDFHGLVWPGAVVFVDFFHPDAKQYWKSMLGILYEKIKFSGIWLDMNEVSNFCSGPCDFPKHQGFDYSSDLPYEIGVKGEPVEMQTISLNCTRYNNISEANVHIYTGFLQTVATFDFLQSKNMRPFILSRSTAPGSGSYGFHWTGDNVATFDFLRNSIHENFMFQIWGIQMVGADICGFVKDTTEQLCGRWHQLGAFYPFSRNHNAFFPKSQEPYALGAKVLEGAKTNIKLRYSLLKSYYCLFVVKRGRGAIFQPLFFSFPEDIITMLDNDVSQTQFMVGEQLMFAPIVTESKTTRSVYFPANFFEFQKGEYITKSSNITITNILTDPAPIFIRQGSGVFMQDTTNITKSSQLSSVFEFRAGLSLVNSDDDVRVYQAKGSILSIQDYGNETKIARCLLQGCSYNTVWRLQEYQNGTKTLTVESTYVGAAGLNELISVEKMALFKEDGVLKHTFSQRLQIVKSQKQTIIVGGSQSNILKVE